MESWIELLARNPGVIAGRVYCIAFIDRFSDEYAPLVSCWREGRCSSSLAELASRLPQYAEQARGL